MVWFGFMLLFDFQKTATAVAHCKEGNGLIKVNGFPLHLVEPATLRYKVVWCTYGGEKTSLS